jgi:hypothetical protein
MYHGQVKDFNAEAGIGRIVPNNGSTEIGFKFVDGRIPTPDSHLPSMELGELPMPKEGDRVVFLNGERGSSAFIWAFEDAYHEACRN